MLDHELTLADERVTAIKIYECISSRKWWCIVLTHKAIRIRPDILVTCLAATFEKGGVMMAIPAGAFALFPKDKVPRKELRKLMRPYSPCGEIDRAAAEQDILVPGMATEEEMRQSEAYRSFIHLYDMGQKLTSTVNN